MRQNKSITKEQVRHIIERYEIEIDNYIIKDGKLDVRGCVTIIGTSLRKLPLKFGNVSGDFFCHANQLNTLKGSPEFVGGDFNCSHNQLTFLKDGPKKVAGNFSCHENQLESLKGAPKHIFGNFNAFLNNLTSLEGAPERVEKNCSLFENQLTSLKSGPRFVGGSFHITGNMLFDLIGLPEFIGNVLSIDSTVSLYTENKNCYVKAVKIEFQQKRHKPVRLLPTVIPEKHIPILLKYMQYLEVFSSEGIFNQTLWEEVIFDIQSGLR
jgi:hypothetical protein